MLINFSLATLQLSAEVAGCRYLTENSSHGPSIFTIQLPSAQQPVLRIQTPAWSSYQLHFKIDGATLTIADHPPPDIPPSALNVEQLHRFLSHCLSSGFFEVDTSTTALHRGWSKIPAQATFSWDGQQPRITELPAPGLESLAEPFQRLDRATLRQEIREQLRRNIRGDASNLTTEFFGGIDSGLLYAGLSQPENQEIFFGGLTYDYPHYEFRHEAGYRQAIAEHVGKSLIYHLRQRQGTFAQIDNNPMVARPSIAATYQFQILGALRQAASLGAAEVLNGIGGDLLFLVPPATQMRRPAISWPAQAVNPRLLEALQDLASSDIQRINSAGGYWNPQLLNIPSNDLIRRSHGITTGYRSPYAEENLLAMLYAYWQKFSAGRSASEFPEPQKPIAYDLFQDWLPERVWQRSGKVDHTGNIYRDALENRAAISQVVQSAAPICDLLELRHTQITQLFIDFTHGIQVDNAYLSYLLALFSWWHSVQSGLGQRASASRQMRFEWAPGR